MLLRTETKTPPVTGANRLSRMTTAGGVGQCVFAYWKPLRYLGGANKQDAEIVSHQLPRLASFESPAIKTAATQNVQKVTTGAQNKRDSRPADCEPHPNKVVEEPQSRLRYRTLNQTGRAEGTVENASTVMRVR